MIFQFQNNSIHYHVYGSGPAIVLLHGFLESSGMWAKVIPFLSENHTVITLDFPGLGKSDVLAETHTMELMAEVVHALLEHLKIESATWVGHSMGGYITLAFIDLFGEKANKIILLNSTSKSDSEERISIRNRSIRLMHEHPKAFVSMAIGNWAVADSREKFKDEINYLKEQAFTFPNEGIIAAIKGMRDRKDRTAALQKFSKPKYLLLAENDPIIPCEETKKIAENAGVVVKVISGGHMSMIENFEETEAFLRASLIR